MAQAPIRRSTRTRSTLETSVEVAVDLDETTPSSIETGLPFFDHMIGQVAKHGRFHLELNARGDLHVDAHHLVEDVGLTLGAALSEALGDRRGIDRFANVAIPMDETLAEVVLDLSGRPYLYYEATFGDPLALGTPGFAPQLGEEFFRALVTELGCALHVTVVRGKNSHHILEGIYKGFGRAFFLAKRITGTEIASTKGVL
ncbi:MAG: imidazoleglycerol-phosphate dehydratase HisB [Acidimicrobiales bacterium]